MIKNNKIHQKNKIKSLNNSQGQIIVEYILLLVVSVALAVIVLKVTDLEEGPFLNFWTKSITVIGEDIST